MLRFILLIFMITELKAQVVDSSFFPNQKTINPGIAHLRQTGFLGADISQTSLEKIVYVPQVDSQGEKTEVSLNKGTFYRAGKGGGITFEFLYDAEEGEKVISFNSLTYGPESTTTTAKSVFQGFVLDLDFIGLSFSNSNYENKFAYRFGSPPTVFAGDDYTYIEFSDVTIGKTFAFGRFRVGGYYRKQTKTGRVDRIYIDTDGTRSPVDPFKLKGEKVVIGYGLGFTGSNFRFELSHEETNEDTLTVDRPLELELDEIEKSSRSSLVLEVKFWKVAIGTNTSLISNNYFDPQNIIVSELFYATQSPKERIQNTFNFSYGTPGGFAVSGFYSESRSSNDERGELFDNGFEYDAEVTSRSYGVNISYVY
jgi:hypothetical protein